MTRQLHRGPVRDYSRLRFSKDVNLFVDHSQIVQLETLCRGIALERAARARGIRRFCCGVLARNRQMRALLRGLAPHALVRNEGGGVLDLAEPGLDELLRLAARESAPPAPAR